MDELHRSTLVSRWVQALIAGSAVPITPGTRQVLDELVEDLAVGLDSDPVDCADGVRVGRRLAELGFTRPVVLAVSACVLSELAEGRTDADRRMAVLLGGVAEGFRAHVEQAGKASLAADRRGVEQCGVAGDRFRNVFDKAAVGIAIADTEGILVEVNQYLADMVGVPGEELRGSSIFRYAYPDEEEANRAVLFDELVPARKGTVRLERRIVRADGSVRWVAFSVTYVQGADVQADYLLAVGEDTTERHRLRAELNWQARHDPLTGLPNRRCLLERIESLISDAREGDSVGLCFVDLDGFKEVNDRYGHRIGDRVLLAVATRMRDNLADDSRLIARLGGDEFVVLVPPPADDRGVGGVAEAMLSALDGSITVDDHRLRMSASVGAVVAGISNIRAEELLDAADRELYRAKKGGKGRWILRVLGSGTRSEDAIQ
ncbi:diguanylate cyclase domain-containing protein [Nocardia sp. AB354]|uniref:diguanylate cyclase domain-containing protein n=1 Tax=Nocardia sp. AB354 TaxID=3413283 RepID=UPI003C20D511